MSITSMLKNEMKQRPAGEYVPFYFRSLGHASTTHATISCRKADGIYSLFTAPNPYIYKNDLIAGSIRPLFVELSEEEKEQAKKNNEPYPERVWKKNFDHYSPDYETILTVGIPGMLKKIDDSAESHKDERDRVDFLESTRIAIGGLRDRILAYAEHAESLKGSKGYDDERLEFIRKNCLTLASEKPQSFAQALQLVWMIHTCFVYEGRFAMALGRIDQYLYPFYQKDMETGTLTDELATELIENVFMKIYEKRAYLNGDDVVNICIGGMDLHENCQVNGLTYCVLHAVGNCNVPGPNLSARVAPGAPDRFLDECLKVIGTGLGYPALMNDAVNIEALRKYGYEEADIYNYSMVGCIENFITGMQPPWTDGKFDVPRFLEYLFNRGTGYFSPGEGIDTGALSEIPTMDVFMEKLEAQLKHGAEVYMEIFRERNAVDDPRQYTSPFLSCFCRPCIERGLDINMGGSKYPSVHGVGLMGIGTMSDSLAAIEKVVFHNHEATLEELRDALIANFEGYEDLRQKLLSAPKYGNNDPFVDKYAVWFVDYLSSVFAPYRTPDGGGIYMAIAANIGNVLLGKTLGATPDGRRQTEPISDAASPTFGRDVRGATSTILSVTRPDYTKAACGTVLNQKYSPSMFEDEKRQKLLDLIRVYFAKGGQEMQINATSTKVLRDAIEHPEEYRDLVVRVSGFSAYYVTLAREVQDDILRRTQQG